MKKFGKLRPEQIAKSLQVFAERLACWSPPRPPVTEGVLVDWYLTATQFPDGAMLLRRL
jgi:hypothetical protein